MGGDRGVKAMVVFNLQYISVSNEHIVYLKLIC